MTLRISSGLVVLALCGSIAAKAQFTQYTPVGALSVVTKTTAEGAKQSAETARWKLGKIALDPRFKLRDLGYYDNVFASANETMAVEDVRGTVGAGLAAFLNLGEKSIVTGYVAPEYSWWKDQDELSELTVNWGAGWFGLFNRLTTTANISLSEQERPLSEEIDAPARIEAQRQEFRAEISLTDAIGLVASFIATEIRNDTGIDPFVPNLSASTLDRDGETTSVGVTLSVRDWKFGAGVESSEVDLLVDLGGRSSSGDSPFAEVEYRAGRIDFHLTAIDRELEFVNPALSVEALTAGSGRLAFELAPTRRITLYGARSLAFAAVDINSVIVQERQGVSLSNKLGRQFELTLIAEAGESAFRDAAGVNRRDDLEVWGGSLLWKVRENLNLRFRVRDSTWDSDLAEFDRSQRSIGIDLDLGSGLFPW